MFLTRERIKARRRKELGLKIGSLWDSKHRPLERQARVQTAMLFCSPSLLELCFARILYEET